MQIWYRATCPQELEDPKLHSSQSTGTCRTPDSAPQAETPPAIAEKPPSALLEKGAALCPPLRTDRVVWSVPGDVANVLQLPLHGVIRGKTLERILA
jgi:hypothetical protein